MSSTTPSQPIPTAATPRGGARAEWVTIACFVLLAGALGVSGYLAYTKLFDVSMLCVGGGLFDCGTVRNSIYSEIMGVPIGLLGFLTNLVLVGVLAGQKRIPFLQEYGPLLFFGILLFATLYSIWLIYVQAQLLQAYCNWCLAHEVIVFALFGLSIVLLRRHNLALDELEAEPA
ncbi:MAG: vitamin K epoxide reductase family protein [Chloroflexi bacterium]|nr:vitamin K epoxide reductase family protein [Chloroflexota bacterium]